MEAVKRWREKDRHGLGGMDCQAPLSHAQFARSLCPRFASNHPSAALTQRTRHEEAEVRRKSEMASERQREVVGPTRVQRNCMHRRQS